MHIAKEIRSEISGRDTEVLPGTSECGFEYVGR